MVHHFGAQERRVIIGGDIFFRGPKVSGGPQSLQNFSFATGQELMVFTSPTNCCHTPTQSCRQATEGKSCFLRFSFFLGRLGGLRAINETLSPFKMSVCPGCQRASSYSRFGGENSWNFSRSLSFHSCFDYV